MKVQKCDLLKATGIALLCFNSASVSAITLTSSVHHRAYFDDNYPDEILSDTSAAGKIRLVPPAVLRLPKEKDIETGDTTSFAISTAESIFEDVSIFSGSKFFTESFRIDAPGAYQAILTDFIFPDPLDRIGINITTATESLGILREPGVFTFDANPGDYFVSFFGKAHRLGQYGISISRAGGSSIASSPVPLPAGVWLFGSGLLGLAGVVRRKTVS